MDYAPIVERLAGLGGAKWDLYYAAQRLKAEGRDVIDLTIGEPDIAPPDSLIEATIAALRAGRTRYSNGQGEARLLDALARRYSARTGRAISPQQFVALPGTQTALFAALTTLVGQGDEVLVGDPMYATYAGLIAATGARLVPVPLRPENGFRMAPEDIAPRITPATKLLFLNTPHNPTGAVLTADQIASIGALATRHNLWILSDEVYEELTFGAPFASPFDQSALAERVVIASSISKSHAAPGFRSGWCAGPLPFAKRLLPVAETMLFGNQPFIADATAEALSAPSKVAQTLRTQLARRADLVARALEGSGLTVHRPEAGMFALIHVHRPAYAYAQDLLAQTGVAVMPGCSFGARLSEWVRLALTVEDPLLETACTRIRTHAPRPDL